MSLLFGMWHVHKDGTKEPLWSGEMPVRNTPGAPLTLEEIESICKEVDGDAERFLVSYRLDMQRAMLLAEPAVLQVIAARIAGDYVKPKKVSGSGTKYIPMRDSNET